MLRLLLVFLAIPSVSHAARITRVSVTNQEAGQSVTVLVLVDSQDPSLRLQVRGFVIQGKEKEKLTTAYTAVETMEVAKPEPGTPFLLITKTFKVPFASLDLPQGEVSLGYAADLSSLGEKPEKLDEMASAIQTLEVKGNRKTLIGEEKPVVEETADAEALLINQDGTTKPADDKVTIHPAREKNGSISLEEQEGRLKLRKEKNPQDLAGARTDVAQPLAAEDKDIVYFATNRAYLPIRGKQNEYTFFPKARLDGGIRGLTWGAARVSLPTRAQEQSWWSSAKAVVLKEYLYGEETTLEKLSNTSSKDVFLFVHGYCNSFDDVILQAGRMKRDLAFKGNIMAFSWPSAGNMRSYGADESHAEDVNELEAFAYVLKKVVIRTKSQGGRVFLMAHSMGNRYMVFGLRKLYKDLGNTWAGLPKEKRTIAVSVFAAPDVDINLFSSVIPNVGEISQLVSFYYSAKDRALGLSSAVHEMTRAGLHPLFNDAVATINTDRVNGWFSVGHSYYSASDRSIFDLYLQFNYLWLPTRRVPPLEEDKKEKRKRQFDHWYLTAK